MELRTDIKQPRVVTKFERKPAHPTADDNIRLAEACIKLASIIIENADVADYD